MESFESFNEPVNEEPKKTPEQDGAFAKLAKKAKKITNIALAGIALAGTAHASEKNPDRSIHENPNDATYEVVHIASDSYEITDKNTGRTIPFGHYEAPEKEIREFGESLFAPLKPWEMKAVETERNLQKSGLVNPTKAPQGKLHREERSFKGDNIDVTTEILADEKGNVANLVEAHDTKNKENKYYQADIVDESNVEK